MDASIPGVYTELPMVLVLVLVLNEMVLVLVLNPDESGWYSSSYSIPMNRDGTRTRTRTQ